MTGLPDVLNVRFFRTDAGIDLGDTIARVLFTVAGCDMILLHGFIKKIQKTPASDMATAKQRKARL